MLRSLVALCLISGILCAATPKPGDPDFFPISPWGNNSWLSVPLTQEYFDSQAELGFTVAGFASTKAELDMIHKAGMVAWAGSLFPRELLMEKGHDPEKYREIASRAVAAWGSHPALLGYYLVDEPNSKAFENIGAAIAELKRQDPAHRVYFNLFPNYAGSDALGNPTYYDHVDQAIAIAKPERISYDFYTFFEGEDVLRRDYWSQLADTRKATLAHGIPFEACVLSIGHLCYRIPTEIDIFFETYSALLYGAKGLFYFTYMPPVNDSYEGGPVDAYGNRTPTWYALRNVVQSVRSIARTLNRLDSTAVYHFQPGEALPDENPPEADSLIEAPTDPGQSLAIGEFIDRENGDRYVMILNKNRKLSADLNGLKWRNGKPAKLQICRQNKKDDLQNFGGENAWARPGHAILLKVE